MTIRDRIRLLSVLPLLLLFSTPNPARAQAPPDSLTAQTEGPNGIQLTWTACPSGTQANCYEYFYIYRNPPSLDTLLTTRNAGDYSSLQYLDTGLQPSTKYTYQVCTDVKLKDGSNCVQASATTFAQPASGGSGGGGGGSSNPGSFTNNAPPPTNVQALAGGSTALLSWQNPTLDFPIITVQRDIPGGTSPTQIAILNPDATDKVPPTRYADTGPLAPHVFYQYYVCTGRPDITFQSCGSSNRITIFGANPVLTATRVSGTSVHLSVAVDNVYTLIALKVTRQDSTDPCRSGGTLGNGSQGCKTRSYGPNGPVNVPVITVVYDKGSPFGASTSSAPYIIKLPADTVAPNVEYYYQAQATWVGPLEQDSQSITVPTWARPTPRHARGNIPPGMIQRIPIKKK